MSWEPGISIPTRQVCRACREPSPVNFYVPNALWLRAVPDYFRNDALCLKCFTSFADEALLAWDDDITFFPCSLRRQIESQERSARYYADRHWRCEGCGALVEPDDEQGGRYGHTLIDDRGDPVVCGPVTFDDPDAAAR